MRFRKINILRNVGILSLVLLFQTFFQRLGWTEQKDYLQARDVQQKLNGALPLDAMFKDESGKDVLLKEYFQDKPVLLTFVYFTCPKLCQLNIQSLARSLKVLKELPGSEYELIVVSFNPEDKSENAGERKKIFMDLLKNQSGHGIHFLTGNADAIEKTTDAAGFQYAKNKDTGEYAHATVLMILTPQGRISRYLFGLEYPPKDIRLALTEARQEKIGSIADKILMYCFTYNPHTGRYSLAILNLLKVAAFLTAAAIGGLVYLLRKQERVCA